MFRLLSLLVRPYRYYSNNAKILTDSNRNFTFFDVRHSFSCSIELDWSIALNWLVFRRSMWGVVCKSKKINKMYYHKNYHQLSIIINYQKLSSLIKIIIFYHQDVYHRFGRFSRAVRFSRFSRRSSTKNRRSVGSTTQPRSTQDIVNTTTVFNGIVDGRDNFLIDRSMTIERLDTFLFSNRPADVFLPLSLTFAFSFSSLKNWAFFWDQVDGPTGLHDVDLKSELLWRSKTNFRTNWMTRQQDWRMTLFLGRLTDRVCCHYFTLTLVADWSKN